MRSEAGSEACGDEGAQKGFEPSDEQAEVVSGGGEDGVRHFIGSRTSALKAVRWRVRVSAYLAIMAA